jgi:hypothetical protein
MAIEEGYRPTAVTLGKLGIDTGFDHVLQLAGETIHGSS